MNDDKSAGWNPGDENTLSPDKQACIALLEHTLAEAKKGTFVAMSIAAVTTGGFGHQMAGSNAVALYMCLGIAQRELEQAVVPKPVAPRQRPTIIRPGQQ